MKYPDRLEFASLGSGSQGNATVVRAGKTIILVDCGFSRRETENRLSQRGISLDDLSAVLVTHEHGDHWRGVPQLAKRENLPVFTSPGTASALMQRTHHDEYLAACLQEFDSSKPFNVGDLVIYPIVVPHDANEPTQFVIRHRGLSFGVLTDCGSITPEMVAHYVNVDALLLEANHDLSMLLEGEYPESLKARVGGDYGHLNNEQSRSFFDQIVQPKLRQLVLGHVSLNNNTSKHVLREFENVPTHLGVHYATQSSGTDWVAVGS